MKEKLAQIVLLLVVLSYFPFLAFSKAEASPYAAVLSYSIDMFDTCKISDLKPLAELKDLEWLDARDNNIVDVSPLCELENLEFLYLSGNPISNLEVLKTLPLVSIEDVLELPVF